jgi:general stress protein 26
MKNILKFEFEHKEGFLSVIEKDHYYYTLVQKETPKVKHIQKTNQLHISYDLKTPVYQEVSVKIIDQADFTQWVYETLKEQNNLYFKTLDDTLCVLEIPKQ